MYDLVSIYLSKNCVVEDYLGYDIMCKHTGHQKGHLCDELSKIFSIDRLEARKYADKWAVLMEPDVDLCVYWVTSVM